MINSFFEGNTTLGKVKIPRLIVGGILGVVLLYVSVAGMISTNAPWMVRGDSQQHIDYVWRLYNKELPARPDGITYPPIVEHNGRYKAQAASKNPPLFYAIHVPFMGPILQDGNMNLAIAIGRAVNIGIGIVCILALAWAGWIFGGSKKHLHSVAVPALSVLIFRFTRLNVDFALDALLVLFGTLSIIFSFKIIKHGITKKYLFYLTTITVAGMLTKVAFIAYFALNLVAIFIAGILHRNKNNLGKSFVKSLTPVLGVLLIVLATTGWYYYIRNYKISGNWFNAVPIGRRGHAREVKSLADVLTSVRFIGLFTSNYIRTNILSELLTGFAFSSILSFLSINYKKLINNRTARVAIGLVLAGMLSTLLIQIAWSVGTGSINFRYMLPALLFFGLFLSYGLLQFNWSRGQFAAGTAILMAITSIGAFGARSPDGYFENRLMESVLGGMYSASHLNGIPSIIPTGLIIAFLLGSLLLSYSLYRLSENRGSVPRVAN